MSMEKRLLGMLARVFADGQLDASEKAELQEMWRTGGLTVPQVRAVMKDFVAKTWSHITADQVITTAEREKLQVIVDELKLPDDCIPEEAKRLLGK
jgi:pyrroloquinoline quinone (PQQ) biosynthesis protein C